MKKKFKEKISEKEFLIVFLKILKKKFFEKKYIEK